MNGALVWKLAWRYLRGKRGLNAVPILSRISMVAIAVGAGAMIVLFSVFNGFEGVVRDLYKAFYPDIRITAARGKFFHLPDSTLQQLRAVPGVARVSRTIEDNVLVNSDNEQIVVTLKGIDPEYFEVNDISPWIIEGRDTVIDYPMPTAIVGAHIAGQLGLSADNALSRIVLYYPNAKQQQVSFASEAAFQSLQLKPDGVFRIQDDFDGRFILAPLALVQSLYLEEGHLSSVELRLTDPNAAGKVRQELRRILGDRFEIATRYEQNRTLYMVMRTEKWAVYAILFLVLLIASFNMVGALSLLVLEKRKDMAILRAMGATSGTIRNVFVAEGILWSLMGGLAGLLVGTAICLGQQYFKWIRLQGSFIIDAYPVVVKPADILLIVATVMVVGALAAWYPAAKAAKAEMPGLKS
jgi:lipoprotein-releasing system permease protein